MNKINLPKFNYPIEKKSYLPAINALLLSVVPWYLSSHFSSEIFSKHLSIQILFFLATFMVNFLTIDRLTNKTNLRLMAPLAIIPILTFIILLFSENTYVALLGLLSFVPFLTTFLPLEQKNGVGLLTFSLSVGTLAPLAFFYIRNGFVTSILLKMGLLLSLMIIVILFAIFIKTSFKFAIFALALTLIITIFAFILLKSWTALIYPILAVFSWFVPKLHLPRNFTLLVLIALIGLASFFITIN
ncbi:hypothetical protein PS421_08435 [Pediococcus pentosaceus]|uniref:hypothetical protein n=1 Tax=Pediococcus pentosaceus TaxID=1255 RepID=UPI00223BCD7D|nr:hypothetical protein [Pediococcus pentosaceus]MCS8564332.1 hypothetical protein [Pediococcus pentosaceus]MCS8567330.1 hypothetical protein [Pediococcus pentosaceus]MCS8580638.1 hypothetical protein [Pediococcus pentosaceus]